MPYKTTETKRAYERGRYRLKSQQINARVLARDAARRQVVAEIKMAKGCTDCGYKAHHAALDFDHVRGEKLFGIGWGLRKTAAALEEEIAKCDVVCANCHRVRTFKRRRGLWKS